MSNLDAILTSRCHYFESLYFYIYYVGVYQLPSQMHCNIGIASAVSFGSKVKHV